MSARLATATILHELAHAAQWHREQRDPAYAARARAWERLPYDDQPDEHEARAAEAFADDFPVAVPVG